MYWIILFAIQGRNYLDILLDILSCCVYARQEDDWLRLTVCCRGESSPPTKPKNQQTHSFIQQSSISNATKHKLQDEERKKQTKQNRREEYEKCNLLKKHETKKVFFFKLKPLRCWKSRKLCKKIVSTRRSLKQQQALQMRCDVVYGFAVVVGLIYFKYNSIVHF